MDDVRESRCGWYNAYFHLGTRPRCPPQGLPLAQSARIHAKRLKLSKFGSLEPENSDTFARNYTLSMIDQFENDLKTLKAEFKL